MLRPGRTGAVALAMLASSLAGCSMAPAYRPPLAPAIPAFREAGPWIAARPGGAITGDGRAGGPADGWWRVHRDPVLDRLESRLAADNPSLAGAVARYDAARGFLMQARGGLFPSIDGTATVTRQRQSDDAPLRGPFPSVYSTHGIGARAEYMPDLWGRVRDDVAARHARARAGADDVAALRLDLERELASDYFALHGIDAEIALLRRSVDAFARADVLTRRRFQGGIASALDTGRSGTLLAGAQAALADAMRTRALTEHVIASLVGVPASAFSLPPSADLPVLPPPPPLVSSTLLQRRPDVAAAERRMAAANAGIGVARAAFFPQVALGATGGFESKALGSVLTAPALVWSLGGDIVSNLFDGGLRRGKVAVARARWREASADYRRTVLDAFGEVEDDLASLHHLGDEIRAEARAAAQADATARVAMSRYIKGAATYLEVVTAQTAALDANRATIALRVRALQSHAGLLTALGGGWHDSATAAATIDGKAR